MIRQHVLHAVEYAPPGAGRLFEVHHVPGGRFRPLLDFLRPGTNLPHLLGTEQAWNHHEAIAMKCGDPGIVQGRICSAGQLFNVHFINC
jgi:hypothetical protein